MMDNIFKVEKHVLQKMCRTCLSEKGEKQPIFSEKKFYRGELSLHTMLEEVASVQVLKDDGLPGTICLTCLQRLHNAFEFKELCEKNNSALHKYLEQNNDVHEKASTTLNHDVLSRINGEKQLIPDIKTETEDEIVDTENIADDAFSSENCSSSGDGETGKVRRKRTRNLTKGDSQDEPTETSIYYKNENGIKIYPCTVCNTNFFQRIRWLRHSQIHNSTKPYVCRKCGKCYKTYVDLSSHWYLHTGEKPYVCDTCGKHYRRQENLRIHIRVHTGERPYLCPDCGKGFKHATELTIHKRTHAPEKHYTCEICGKKLMNLSTHMRAHMNYKPHECEHCGKKFTVKAYLERHLVVHTGAKPYICTACGKAFNRMSTLRTHALIHTNIRPHKCQICGRAFLQKHVLQSHMNTHRPQYIP